MSDQRLVDARGLSCPEPVLLTREALAESAGAAFGVIVSSPTARDNVARALAGAGRKFVAQEAKGEWTIHVAEK